ncbi:MAG TPA: hypothetical protein VE223_06900 [Nitrososphaeraceae archaeon]|nr:hypothetical protein [Nitrososphaeraceae archaeon]
MPVDATIHCYSIQGPEISLLLHGRPGTTDQVELWVCLAKLNNSIQSSQYGIANKIHIIIREAANWDKDFL